MLQLETENFQFQFHYSDNLAMLLITVLQVFYSIGLLFTGTEICERVNRAFDKCSTAVEQLDWYRFPTKIQRIFPLILLITQQPIEITCFGGTICNRDTFKRVSEI